jgi:GNAT superfamily N-acetyltransferase
MSETPQPLRLRPFCAADAPAVPGWFEGGGLLLPPPGTAWAARLVTDPRIRAYVAEDAHGAFGMIRFDCGPDGFAELTLVVAPARRRRGLGRAIFEAALPQVRELGVRGLVAFVGIEDRAALRFFERAGFCQQGLVGDRLRLQRLVHAGGSQVEPLDVSV